MATLGILAACFGFSVLSALIPIFNAEIYLLANIALVDSALVWPLVLVMSIGTVIGKLMIFWGVRSGKRAADKKLESKAKELTRTKTETKQGPIRTRIRQWSQTLLRFLEDPVKGTLTIFVSAVIGIPPLAVVAFLAGASKQNVWLFGLAVFFGRAIRFGAVAVFGVEMGNLVGFHL